MTDRLHNPEPFLRGRPYPGVASVPYPRANPADADHLSVDEWDAAQLPAGVRLEFVGDVDAVRVHYKTTTGNLGYRGEGAGCTFAVYRSGQKVVEVDAVLGEGMAELPMTGEPGRPAIVYLPEGMRPLITGIEGIGGEIAPAPLQPRWLSYGDAITQGWLASAPAASWPTVTARKMGLDLCNFGYSGSACGETTAAAMLADCPADLVTIAFGLNNWSRVPHTPGLVAEKIRAFIGLVRDGHPEIPVIVLSPLLRPDAEMTPNRLDATLADLRVAMEDAVRLQIAAGDVRLQLVQGGSVLGPNDLADNVYPNDEGHKRIAAAVGRSLMIAVPDIRASAERRWTGDDSSELVDASRSGAQPRFTTPGGAPRPGHAFTMGSAGERPHMARQRAVEQTGAA